MSNRILVKGDVIFDTDGSQIKVVNHSFLKDNTPFYCVEKGERITHISAQFLDFSDDELVFAKTPVFSKNNNNTKTSRTTSAVPRLTRKKAASTKPVGELGEDDFDVTEAAHELSPEEMQARLAQLADDKDADVDDFFTE